MSGTLGPGQRVWIGWTQAKTRREREYDPRCKKGTLLEGPSPAGDELALHSSWLVAVDGLRPRMQIAEYLLKPIDGDDELVGEDECRRPETIHCASGLE